MEYYQTVQNRAGQTVAVIKENLPALTVGGLGAPDLLAQSQALDGLAQIRDDALAADDTANNAENLGFLGIQSLTLSLPQAAAGDLSDEIPAESALLDLLSPVYSIKPRTTELALERGQKLVSALTRINAYLTSLTPPRAAITSGGRGLAELSAAIEAQPVLEQTVEDTAADVSSARAALRVAAKTLDRLNKRFYTRLKSEARANPALADALAQIETESAGEPGILGLRSILQGGADNRHLLLTYDNGSFDETATNTVEWMVAGVDTDFTNTAPADSSGNALGPFAIGETVELRTRVTNTKGTNTGSVRTLTLGKLG